MADDKRDAKQPPETEDPTPEPRHAPRQTEYFAGAADPDNPLIWRGID